MANLSAARIVDALADAAERWRDADFPARVRATHAVMQRTGYTEPVVDFALDALFDDLTRATLRATIAGELGALEALDGFVARAGRPAVHYRGVDVATIVSSDTTIGVAIPALAFALCAKVGTLVVKDRSDGLVSAFVETIAEERPELGACVRVERWEGYSAPEALAALTESDVVVAFGGDAALAAIRARLRPDARFVPYGHRTSVAYVARETLADTAVARAAAAGIARDALLYDGAGCLSLHAVFVERGGALEPAAFGALLAEALDAAAVEFPSGADEPANSTAIYASTARFRATQGASAVRGGVTAAHVLVIDAAADEAPPLLPRALATHAIDGPDEAAAYLRRHAVPLEGFALDTATGDARPDVLALAVASGASRVAPFGALQTPSIAGEHGGTPRILSFVRAIAREGSHR